MADEAQPVDRKRELQLSTLKDDGTLVLLNPDGSTYDDLKLPDNDTGKRIKKLYDLGHIFNVVVQTDDDGKDEVVDVVGTS
ncbi:translation initiation factor eIF5A [Oleoguttula sp. CCFEE 5521]|nr:hypothetical protein B0A51_06263 [Rachicladosporium sp. CCFEE 5018]